MAENEQDQYEMALMIAHEMQKVLYLPLIFGQQNSVLYLSWNFIKTTTDCHGWNTAGWVVNSVDPDQMPHYVASDLGLHCLLTPVCPNT